MHEGAGKNKVVDLRREKFDVAEDNIFRGDQLVRIDPVTKQEIVQAECDEEIVVKSVNILDEEALAIIHG